MRIVFFGTGSPLSLRALEALAPRGVTTVVVPHGWRRRRARKPLIALAKRLGIDVVSFADADRVRADLFCVAAFPHILPRALLEIPRFGALNVHPSLLPKHRGADPLFWTYFHDDAEAVASVHWIGDKVDGGDLVSQTAIPMKRGEPVAELYDRLSRAAATLLAEAVDAVANGTAARTPQDESRVTRDPSPRPGTFDLDFATWPAERVWHVVRGLGARRHDLLPVTHGPATRYSLGASNPGTIEKTGDGYRVHCADGTVDVERAPLMARVRRRVLGAMALS